MRRGLLSNELFKHHSQVHQNQNLVPDYFRSRPVRGGMKFNLDRFILEAHKIDEASRNPNIKLLNSRAEWGQRGIPRLAVQ